MKTKGYLGEFLGTFIWNTLAESLPGNCQEEVLAWRYLQPGRPNPTHRFSETVQ